MINLVQILGRVGKIETKNTASNLKITNLSMVTSKKYVKNGEKVEKVTWHNISLYSKLAEIAEKYVSVGDLLYIQGEIENQKYKGQDGQERTRFFINGNEIKLMPKNKEYKKQETAPANHDDPFQDSEIPF